MAAPQKIEVLAVYDLPSPPKGTIAAPALQHGMSTPTMIDVKFRVAVLERYMVWLFIEGTRPQSGPRIRYYGYDRYADAEIEPSEPLVAGKMVTMQLPNNATAPVVPTMGFWASGMEDGETWLWHPKWGVAVPAPQANPIRQPCGIITVNEVLRMQRNPLFRAVYDCALMAGLKCDKCMQLLPGATPAPAPVAPVAVAPAPTIVTLHASVVGTGEWVQIKLVTDWGYCACQVLSTVGMARMRLFLNKDVEWITLNCSRGPENITWSWEDDYSDLRIVFSVGRNTVEIKRPELRRVDEFLLELARD